MRLSIVIPTLNEAPALGSLLPHAFEHADEVVVSDGRGGDATAEIAASLGARVVCGGPGRGAQLNLGAGAASGEVLLFLHADSRLGGGAGAAVRRAVAEGAAGGGFRVRFDDPRRIFRLGDRLVNLRSRLTGCPLGDQGQFATRAAFEALGGFRDWPILEDLDFVRRLKRHGRTVLLPQRVTTSARRFAGQGIARTIATNWLIWALYFAGVSPHRLAGLYRHVR